MSSEVPIREFSYIDFAKLLVKVIFKTRMGKEGASDRAGLKWDPRRREDKDKDRSMVGDTGGVERDGLRGRVAVCLLTLITQKGSTTKIRLILLSCLEASVKLV